MPPVARIIGIGICTSISKCYIRLRIPPVTIISSTIITGLRVKELKLSYYIGEALLFTIYTHYGNLILVP